MQLRTTGEIVVESGIAQMQDDQEMRSVIEEIAVRAASNTNDVM